MLRAVTRGATQLRQSQPLCLVAGPSSGAYRTFADTVSAHVKQDAELDALVPHETPNSRKYNQTDAARSSGASPKSYLRISNLPKSALHNDVWRLLKRMDVKGCLDVYLDYSGFMPRGAAWVSFATKAEHDAAKWSLARAHVATMPVRLTTTAGSPFKSSRMRGKEGRESARARGVALIGDGPDGAIPDRGTTVVVYGLPGKLLPLTFRSNVLKSFSLVDTLHGGVWKMESTKTLTSRFHVQATSVAEAHRIVRTIHQTVYEPKDFGDRYVMRARVVG